MPGFPFVPLPWARHWLWLLCCAGVSGMPGCRQGPVPAVQESGIEPVIVTERVSRDSDDPAIWIHPDDPSRSLVLGTDKGGKVYAFDLQGRVVRTVSGLGRPNNVDVEYGLELDGRPTDIAVVTDRDRRLLRVFSLPDMRAIDGGGIAAFEGEPDSRRRPMGVGLYRRPRDGAIFAIVSRKEGPSGHYLWQYRLRDGGNGRVVFDRIRSFGEFAGRGEIEAVVVDDESGYVYYSDEGAGIRKYHADPDAPDAGRQLAFFGREGFTEDREGLSIYRTGTGTGYILASDQQADTFRIFAREGSPGNPHRHELVKVIRLSTRESDGSDATSTPLCPGFPAGLFVAMSDDATFQYYDWRDIAAADLVSAPDGGCR